MYVPRSRYFHRLADLRDVCETQEVVLRVEGAKRSDDARLQDEHVNRAPELPHQDDLRVISIRRFVL